MRIIGISPDVWISSAAIIEDGKIIAASAEERFNRQKASQVFPVEAIKYCLEQANVSIEDIDYISMAWNPGINIQSANARFSKLIRWRGEQLYAVPSTLLANFPLPDVECIEQKLIFRNGELPIIYVNHHCAHAANAFFLSPFSEAAILTVDGKGEKETCFFGKGNDNNIQRFQSIHMPHSLGLFYSSLTEYLGFRPHSGEWKVMALASSDEGENEYYEKFKTLISLEDEGRFELDLSYFSYYTFDKQTTMYTEKLIQLFGPPRLRDSKIEKRHIEIASALQRIFEDAATHLLLYLYEQTKCEKLVFSGGCAMNSVFNGKISDLTPFKDVFISSCPDDSGTSIGAALYLYNSILMNKRRNIPLHNYWGPSFSNEEIKTTIDKYKLKGVFHADIEKTVAQLIAEGSLVGWFQGKMEFGQRALGNRSILADPRNARVKDLVNHAVKFRESFRPFAPAVLEEDASLYFEGQGSVSVPFMEKVYKVKDGKRELIPAVVHVDGTSRVQTVSKLLNPLFHNLIREFKNITGIGVVLNTSFNLNGEPIVCSPTDAVKTFFQCGLDYLVLGNYLVSKK